MGKLFRMRLGEDNSRLPRQGDRVWWWFVIVLGLMPVGGWADESHLWVGGYVKGFATLQDPASVREINDSERQQIWLNPIRLKLFWQPGSWVSGELAYELAGRVQRGVAAGAGDLPRPAPFAYRVKDLRTHLYPASGGFGRTFALTQNLDRALITICLPLVDIYVGRQAIAFGSARVVNPTDVVAPFTYEALDKEERVGVDAIRLRFPVGMMGELDVGAISGRNFWLKHGAGFVRSRFYVQETDVLLMAMVFQEHLLLGVDLARSLVDAGSWLEAAWTRTSGGRSFVRLSGGLDYQFANGLYGFFEYHLNGAGLSREGDYLRLLLDPAYTEGGVYLLGRHYAAPGLTCQATLLLTVSLQTLLSLTDGSAFLAPGFEYGLSQDVFVSGGMFYGLGRGPQSRKSEIDGSMEIEPRSEFGLYPAIYFVSLRYYL